MATNEQVQAAKTVLGRVRLDAGTPPEQFDATVRAALEAAEKVGPRPSPTPNGRRSGTR